MNSQTSEILRHLEKGRQLTALEALRYFGCLRLAARVDDLRRRGLDIRTRMARIGGKRVAVYSLCKS